MSSVLPRKRLYREGVDARRAPCGRQPSPSAQPPKRLKCSCLDLKQARNSTGRFAPLLPGRLWPKAGQQDPKKPQPPRSSLRGGLKQAMEGRDQVLSLLSLQPREAMGAVQLHG